MDLTLLLGSLWHLYTYNIGLKPEVNLKHYIKGLGECKCLNDC